jgi:hypothetical protein
MTPTLLKLGRPLPMASPGDGTVSSSELELSHDDALDTRDLP